MSLTLHYFNGRGLCEPVRWILHVTGVEFTENRIPFDSFPPSLPQEIKSKGRWGQVPVAEFSDGKTLTQSTALARYFARIGKLIPEDAYAAALCDEYVDAVRDLHVALFPPYLIKDPKEKADKIQEVLKTVRPKYLDVFESLVKGNGGKHLVGNSLTWADIYLANILNNYGIILGMELTEGYPNLKNLMDSVTNLPQIKAWLDRRPKTEL